MVNNLTLKRSLKTAALMLGVAVCSANLASAEDLAPLELKLPNAAFAGTPVNLPPGSNVEPISKTPRPPLMAPKNIKNLAPAAKISSSDTNTPAEKLSQITDGDKEPASMILLRKGVRYVQFDLGSPQELFAIVFWHAHDSTKVYHDVIVQLADDAEFTQNVRTLFNNDQDNTSGRGVGTDREYFETREGKLIDAKGAKATFVRLYSKGSTDSSMNEYTEVEIYGRPAK